MTNEEYLRQQLVWVERRMGALAEIEARLTEMRALAEYARDNSLSRVQTREINAKLQGLQQEVTKLDEQSKVFWLDYQ
ncbi:hypothetical protein SAMN05660649_00189 [Desulfotomaculum arcticum]|uniref:Uncharacterized protein n=1 Tax=Desulfotruncus arcticus DSM 17038 TaxID=1121424 RepID=A0A1I2MWS3_9FIRM|nr:hypothetical protein [Desulfotruncus arcticus]SFF95558.1 hypothetical protein SAMN05660649_00189 [Desulfotomaculum arcticum] [Desulfotruncus arcticus DSM 17038]